MKTKSGASVQDTLRMTIVKDSCGPNCPHERAKKGDVAQTAIKEGDTVLVDGVPKEVVAVTTDWCGKTGIFIVSGKRRQLAAAVLHFEDGETQFVDSSVQKICPKCEQIVVRFT